MEGIMSSLERASCLGREIDSLGPSGPHIMGRMAGRDSIKLRLAMGSSWAV